MADADFQKPEPIKPIEDGASSAAHDAEAAVNDLQARLEALKSQIASYESKPEQEAESSIVESTAEVQHEPVEGDVSESGFDDADDAAVTEELLGEDDPEICDESELSDETELEDETDYSPAIYTPKPIEVVSTESSDESQRAYHDETELTEAQKQEFDDFKAAYESQFELRLRALQEREELYHKKMKDQKEIHRRQKRHDERIHKAEAVLHERNNKIEQQKAQLEEQARGLKQQEQLLAEMKERAREVVSLHQELLDAKRLLQVTEQRMIKKWSAGRSLTIIACWVVCLFILAAGSYVAGHRLYKPVYEAATEIERSFAETRNSELFIKNQRTILLSQQVLSNTLKTLEQQQILGPATIDRLRIILQKHLTIVPVSSIPGRLRLVLHHPEPELLKPLLQALTSAYVIECVQMDKKAGFNSGATAIRMAPAVSVEPVEDLRIRQSTMYFSVGFAVLIVIVFVVRKLVLLTSTPESADLDNLVDETSMGKRLGNTSQL